MLDALALSPNLQAVVAGLGYIPSMLDENDERPAREQIAENYVGGWFPMDGWTLNKDGSIEFGNVPDDEPPEVYQPLAAMFLRDEVLLVYPYAWVAIVQPDDSFEVSRMD